jgi:hypothetical protein
MTDTPMDSAATPRVEPQSVGPSPAGSSPAASRPKADGPPVAGRPKADAKRPYHVGVAIGLTTGVYAMSLLATTRLQIENDRALIADRSPVEAAISALGDHHQWMGDQLDEARVQYAIGTAGYDALRSQLVAMDKRLAKLDQVVVAVEKLTASLPMTLNLGSYRAPSGHSSSVGGGHSSSGGSSTRLPPAPPPPKAAPPPAGGTTGASGAP